MLVIELARLRRALGTEMYFSTHSINHEIKCHGIGRHGNGSIGDYVNPVNVELVKIQIMGCSRGYNIIPTGGLLRVS